MLFMRNIARSSALAKTLLCYRLPSVLPVPAFRALSSSQALGNIVTSPLPDIQPPTGNLVNTIFENVHQWGSKTAVECSVTGRKFTYNQVLDGIDKWAGFLTRLGLKKGDFIAVYMANCMEYPIVSLGCAKVGIIFTSLNPDYTAEELFKQLNDSGAKLLVGDPKLTATISAGLAMYKRPVQVVINGPTGGIQGALNLQEILKDTTLPHADDVDLTGQEMCVLPFSSGTTGLPKGVALSHNALTANIRMFCHPSVFPVRKTTGSEQEAFVCLLPFYHIFGMFVNMFVGFHAGVKLIVVPKFDPNTFVDTVRENKVETLYLVPSLLNFLIHSTAATPEAFATLRSLFISAAPVLHSAVEAFKDKINRDFFTQGCLGSTEALAVSVSPLNDEGFGTCGQLLSNVSAKIVDVATRETLPSSAIGEIFIKTPAMMSGYFQNEAATASTIDEDGWLHSGDVGYFDDRGFLKVVDRTKDFIKVKGMQVSPSELEDLIRQHPQVKEVGVIGIPHERYGEVPRAYVVYKSKIHDYDIHRFIDSRVARHKKLTGGVVFLPELPRTATGKLLRRELLKMALG